MLLALKLVLVPALVLAVTLAARRWGARVAGLLASLPLVAGPTLLFFALEQGEAFAARAAAATLVGLVGVAAFGVVYARVSRRHRWPASLLLGWGAWALAVVPLSRLSWSLAPAALAAVLSFWAARLGLPRSTGPAAAPARPAWDLPLRMASAMGLVLALTALAGRLGPAQSGALTPFPVAIAVLLAFTHAQQGAPVVIRFLRAFLPGMWSFVAFCVALALLLPPTGVALGFAGALAAQLAVQAALLRVAP